ncbi:hypothetical protein [Aphanothece sacrum]|uniref:Uncharacterized protein n=1 Tax=Aphanothece sacrum FPU1 TaxID=1920663 RepID=A0A401ICS2_APHSA|nr:hypothetical protein [Aphanothece sacrum]GBF79052.1 hypothetical protein AsFPU1_0444 [Aphanothece sacrum FPU1]GBF86011.1 hypothetical protein AsFPU3_3081 [Aphanothece sacrum FPU3]
MKIGHIAIIFNSVGICLTLLIMLYAKRFEPSVIGLFMPPATPPYPTAGFLTHTFQLLCCIPPVICAFTFSFLKKISPQHKNLNFLLGSSLITSAFLMNEIYRIHIIFLYFNIPKIITIQVYAIIMLIYFFVFWKDLKQTPYHIIIISVILLFLAIIADSLFLRGVIYNPLIEGLPKLFSGLNYALYYWIIGYQELHNSWVNRKS